jgi:hypothetical protein
MDCTPTPHPLPQKNSISNLTNTYNSIVHVRNSLSAGQNLPRVVAPTEQEENSLSPNFPSQTLHFSSQLFTILATEFLLQDYNSPYVSAMYLTSHTANYLNFWYFYSNPYFISLFTVNFKHPLCF